MIILYEKRFSKTTKKMMSYIKIDYCNLIGYSRDMKTIKELRQQTGLSQRNFAEKFSIPVRTVQKWEIGQATPPPYINTMIERILDLENSLGDIKKWME